MNVLILTMAAVLIIGIFAVGNVSGMVAKRIPITGCRLSGCQDITLYWNNANKQSTAYNCGSQVLRLQAPVYNTNVGLNLNIRKSYTANLGKTVELEQYTVQLKGATRDKASTSRYTVKLRVCPYGKK